MSGLNIRSDGKGEPGIKAYDVNQYLHGGFHTDIKDFAACGSVKTGYENIDVITSLYPGLYVLGAISSLGKTSFMWQMCDQMADAGEHIIFFSFEQTALELTSKSLSRIMAKKDAACGMTSLQIRMNGDDPRVREAVEDYDRIAGRITIAECGFRTTVKEIEDFVRNYIDQRKIRPIVVIDYLQLIQGDPNSRMTVRDLVDMNVRRLKQLQSDNHLILFVISSLNRQNYLTQIDYESFKETGLIEFHSDCVMGIQLRVLNEDLFDKQGNINEKRMAVREAKAANPRKIELVCLKNRFGVSSYHCYFDYFPAFDLFEADCTGMDQTFLDNVVFEAAKDKDGFVSDPKIIQQMSLPFD